MKGVRCVSVMEWSVTHRFLDLEDFLNFKQSGEVLPHSRYRVLTENHLMRVYLDELEKGENDSLAIEIARLFVESPQKALSRGRVLIERVRSQEADDKFNRTVLSLIQGIIFYKFPLLTLAELETMLDLGDFRKTPLYQSIVEKTRQEILEQTEQKIEIAIQKERTKPIPNLLKLGLSVQQISDCLNINLEIVKDINKKYNQQIFSLGILRNHAFSEKKYYSGTCVNH
ncbi:MAG: DUF2887 domain-containing protein [Cyanobacteria bacterium SBLK]|nr:DUF2887 domain-containing protein [Cyanobacteria bacterium SBLK]